MRRLIGLAAAAVMLAASVCAVYRPTPAAPAPQAGGGAVPRVEYGQVQSIDVVRAENQTTGGGALLGGVLGAVVGRQVGSGFGRDAGTVVGAVGGAVIGNQIEKNNRGVQDIYRVTIQTSQGQVRRFDYQQLADLRVGDRVRIEGNQVYRY
jgi:outer membrane lipoprotein SlyB